MLIQRIALACLLGSTALATHMTFSLKAYAAARSLSAVMSDMGRAFGQIARPVQEGRAGAAEAAVAQRLHSLVQEADTILPDSADTSARVALYHSLMKQLAAAVNELELGITAGDSARANKALQTVLRIRGQGHTEFKI